MERQGLTAPQAPPVRAAQMGQVVLPERPVPMALTDRLGLLGLTARLDLPAPAVRMGLMGQAGLPGEMDPMEQADHRAHQEQTVHPAQVVPMA